jgi:hypothetical protein
MIQKEKEAYLKQKRILLDEWRGRIDQMVERDSDIITKTDRKELDQVDRAVHKAFEQLKTTDRKSWSSRKIEFENMLEDLRKLVQEKFVRATNKPL